MIDWQVGHVSTNPIEGSRFFFTFMKYTHQPNQPTIFALHSKQCFRNQSTIRSGLRVLSILLLLSSVTAARGQADNEVYLDDRENHSWSYYSDSTCHVRSLNPADVRIRYFAYGTNTMYSSNDAEPIGSPDVSVAASAVGIGIDAPHKNTYVYHKTLERVNGEQAVSAAAADGPCFYRLIPNPYSLRPTYGTGDTRWRGFYRWRLKALGGGAVYRDTAMTLPVPVGTMLEAEDTVYFMPAAEYGMQVDFEAIWARAFVFPTILALDTEATAGAYATGENAYERNFVIHSNDAASRWQRDITGIVKDFTLSAIYPDGTDGSSATRLTSVPNTPNMFSQSGWTAQTSSNLNHFFLPQETIKFEYIKLSAGHSWIQWSHLNGGRFITGRMCLPEEGKTGFLFTPGTNYLRCISPSDLSSTRDKKCRWRLESGDLLLHLYFGYAEGGLSPSMYGKVTVDVVLGSDYDRSLNDNTKLTIAVARGTRCVFQDIRNRSTRQMNYVLKSGLITGQYNNNIFKIVFNIGHGHNPKYCGTTTVVVEGGSFPDIAIGHDCMPGDPTYLDTTVMQGRLYMKGGLVKTSIWGGGNRADGVGCRRMVFTGGEINGWIAGGCNGTDPSYGGIVQGDINIYFGGHARLQHSPSDPMHWYSKGGNLYGAGSGYLNDHATIGMVNKTYIVVADSAFVSRDVYGGGNRGFTRNVANVQIKGGTVRGNVFGGSNQKSGRAANVEVAGGQVLGSVYGGSNQSGTMRGPIQVHVKGGTLGTAGCADTIGNVFGGGRGNSTSVNGPVHVIVGRFDAQHPPVSNPLIHGHVFGGGYGGTVTSASQPVRVTTYGGEIKKSVFGGGYGQTAVTTASTEVRILGTSTIRGNVYGGGNMGKIRGNTRVIIGE